MTVQEQLTAEDSTPAPTPSQPPVVVEDDLEDEEGSEGKAT
jgi:hypothetical protein